MRLDAIVCRITDKITHSYQELYNKDTLCYNTFNFPDWALKYSVTINRELLDWDKVSRDTKLIIPKDYLDTNGELYVLLEGKYNIQRYIKYLDIPIKNFTCKVIYYNPINYNIQNVNSNIEDIFCMD